jgi:hypothetical protein
MVNSRTRNQRLVTYGAVKGQPRSETNTAAQSSPTKGPSKNATLPSSSRLSRPHTSLQIINEDCQPSGSVGTTTAHVIAQTQTSTDSNVYDLPSSGDEKPIVRRKRRRPSQDTNKQSPETKRTVRPRDTPSSKAREIGDRDAVMLSEVEKDASVDGMPVATTQEAGLQPSLGKSSFSLYSKVGRPLRVKTGISDFDHPPKASTEGSLAVSEFDQTSSTNANQRYTENTTPGRKRLIDSLGTTKYPVETPKNPAASQQPQNLILRSPTSPSVFAEGHIDNPIQASPASAPSHLRSAGVTYARQRSFLDELSMADDLTPVIPGPKHRSQSVQRQLNYDATSGAQSIVSNEDTNDDGSVRSIHELRQAGGNARYRGAVESIFEDIEDVQNSLSGRCNAFIQLCDKLLDAKLKRRFVECNFDRRLVDCLSIDLQMVPTILAFCAYALGSSDGHMSFVLATSAWPKLLELSPMLLEIQEDISEMAKGQTYNLTRPLQKTIQNIVPRMSDMLFPEIATSILSPCTLALYCLKMTISTMRTKGESPGGISTSLFRTLMRILLSESKHCVSQKKLPAQSSQTLCMVFSVLEALTASAESLNDKHRDVMGPLSTLHDLFYLQIDRADVGSQKIQALFIRVILNVTNSNPAICDEFANREMVGGLVHMVFANFGDLTEDALGRENNSLDSVILALGALINLTEQSESSRSIFLHSAGSTKSFLDNLLHLFTTYVDSISTVSFSITFLLRFLSTHRTDRTFLGSFRLGGPSQCCCGISSRSSTKSLLGS